MTPARPRGALGMADVSIRRALQDLARLGLLALALGCSPVPSSCNVHTESDAGPACEPEGIGGNAQESDHDRLMGYVVADPGGDWWMYRAVRKGLLYDFRVRVPASLATTDLRVASSKPDRAEVTFTRVESDCDGSMMLHGTVAYQGEGEVAIVVYDDQTELDRFTLAVRELDRIEVVATLEDTDAGAGFEEVALEALTFDERTSLRLVLLSEDGEELAGEEQTYWTIDDHDIATFEGQSIVRAPWTALVPVAPGTTLMRVRSTGHELTIPLTVSGVPDAGL